MVEKQERLQAKLVIERKYDGKKMPLAHRVSTTAEQYTK